MMKFRCNLRTIEDQTRMKNLITPKFVTICFVGIAFLTTNIFLRHGYEMDKIILLHFNILLNTIIIFIIFPKYIIIQNENLQLYVSVYHHYPPPVLPWQLPENFNSGNVQLTIVTYSH